MKTTPKTWSDKAAATFSAALVSLALSACKQSAQADKPTEPPPKVAQGSAAQVRAEDTLVQQAGSSCRRRIQDAAQEHAANTKRVQEANVLDMKEVTQREQLGSRRELVRRYLASNEALRSLLVNEAAAFTQALKELNVPQTRIAAEERAFQSGVRDRELVIRKREADGRMGNSLLGMLDFLDELWGQWNYNKEYDRVQFTPPGALKKYNDFLEQIEAASKEQRGLQEQ